MSLEHVVLKRDAEAAARKAARNGADETASFFPFFLASVMIGVVGACLLGWGVGALMDWLSLSISPLVALLGFLLFWAWACVGLAATVLAALFK